jgi:uncharacterized protein YjbJ (UPF0337 family)
LADPPDRKEHAVPNTDEIKGRVKEAAGDLTDDRDLEREGKVDRAAGKAKDKVGDVVDAVKEKLHRD